MVGTEARSLSRVPPVRDTRPSRKPFMSSGWTPAAAARRKWDTPLAIRGARAALSSAISRSSSGAVPLAETGGSPALRLRFPILAAFELPVDGAGSDLQQTGRQLLVAAHVLEGLQDRLAFDLRQRGTHRERQSSGRSSRSAVRLREVSDTKGVPSAQDH